MSLLSGILSVHSHCLVKSLCACSCSLILATKLNDALIHSKIKFAIMIKYVAIPNIFDRKFAVTNSDQVWCRDLTFICTGNRWAYLAVVTDLFARKPVGCASSHSSDSNLICQALNMAYESRRRPKEVMLYND